MPLNASDFAESDYYKRQTFEPGPEDEDRFPPPPDDGGQFEPDNENNREGPRAGSTGNASSPRDKGDRTTIAHHGVLVPTERDRLDIVQPLAAAPTFPVETLPPLMKGAVAALAEHVQAPLSLCAHSVLSAGMLVAQGL